MQLYRWRESNHGGNCVNCLTAVYRPRVLYTTLFILYVNSRPSLRGHQMSSNPRICVDYGVEITKMADYVRLYMAAGQSP